MIKEKNIHLVAFHSHMFKAAELNYNIHNKELFIMFEVIYRASLPKRVRTFFRCYYRSQEPRILLDYQNPLPLPSKIVGVPLLVQPYYLFPFRISRIQV